MKLPGPDHPITIEPFDGRVAVAFNGVPLGSSTRALVLHEARLPPVFYLPRDDLEMGFFARTSRRTTCPYKGEASYFTVRGNDAFAENAAWSYETPYPAMAAIAGHLAFYTDKVEITAAPR